MRKSRFLSRIVLTAIIAATFATAAEAAPQGCTPPGAWATRTPYTNTISRGWGAFYPPDGKFYIMGGRPDDVAGDDFIQVHIYDPVADTWSESNATFTDNQNNNMVGGVLDFGGQQLIVTVGGSAAGGTTASSNVQTYDPVADSLQLLSNDPWPGNTDGAILPGGAVVYENKLFVFGGAPLHSSGGAVPAPSHVCTLGIVPLAENARDVRARVMAGCWLLAAG